MPLNIKTPPKGLELGFGNASYVISIVCLSILFYIELKLPPGLM